MEDPFRPSLDISAQDGMEHPLLGSGMLSIELLDQFLSVLAFGISVYRTFFLLDREIVLMLKPITSASFKNIRGRMTVRSIRSR